ncbi:hypothetical protein P9222_02320 [Paenibacillus amylolyticus]|nr:hypothetical protein [Paenibacillus amylolyticus]WFR63263.1 hypothetical protein P9222_02320 [Paenibacillus amylolyticus]
MDMGITRVEKNIFRQNTDEIASELVQSLSNTDNSILLFKVLALAVKNNAEFVRGLDESIFEDTDIFREKYVTLLKHALSQAVDVPTGITDSGVPSTEPVHSYTPKELSVFFGVSITTIFNWMDQGRFIGIQRAGSNKHNLIPDDTTYVYGSGKRTTIKEIVSMWEKEDAEHQSTLEVSDLDYHTGQIALYEDKYKGEFQHTLGTKLNLTPEEETDAQVWKHHLGRQRLGFKDTEK